MKWVQNEVEKHGFDFETMRRAGPDKDDIRKAHIERLTWNMYVISHFTELGLKPFGSKKKWVSLLGE
jgi:hypothetical protein